MHQLLNANLWRLCFTVMRADPGIFLLCATLLLTPIFLLSSTFQTPYLVFQIIAGTVIVAASYSVLINRLRGQRVIEAFAKDQRLPRPDMPTYKPVRRSIWGLFLYCILLIVLMIVLFLFPYLVSLMLRSPAALVDIGPSLALGFSLIAAAYLLCATRTALRSAVDHKPAGLRAALRRRGTGGLLMEIITGMVLAAIVTYVLVNVACPFFVRLFIQILPPISDILGFSPLDIVLPVILVLFAVFAALTSLFCAMMIAATLSRHYVRHERK